jgi:hypothetical protein
MKLSLLLLALAPLTACSTLEAFVPGGGDLDQMAAVNLGQRIFDDAGAACLDEQPNIGLEYALWREDGLFGYEFGVHHHTDRGDLPVLGNTRVQGVELTAGLRRVFPIEGSSLTPYAGLGLGGYWVDRDEEVPSNRDGAESGLGAYARLGVTAPLSEHTFIGLDVRFIQEEFIQAGDLDLDGDVVSLIFGLSF